MTHEQLRWWSVREIGALQEEAKNASAQTRILQKEVDDLKGRVDTKAEALPVSHELDRLRGDVGEEFRIMRTELTKTSSELGEHVQSAFNQARAVETSFQSHVSQGFGEAVTALKWLEEQTRDRFNQVEAQIAVLQNSTEPHPPPTPAEPRVHTRRPAPAPSPLSGCAAGPFACGCGRGAVPGGAPGLASVASDPGRSGPSEAPELASVAL